MTPAIIICMLTSSLITDYALQSIPYFSRSGQAVMRQAGRLRKHFAGNDNEVNSESTDDVYAALQR